MESAALVTDDAVLFGMLAGILALVFWTASHPAPFWRRFYSIVPALALCYCLPALLNTLGIIDGRNNAIYPVARDYLLPAALVLLTLSIDLKGLLGLGPRLLIMFATGTVGVMLGAPIAFLVVGAEPGNSGRRHRREWAAWPAVDRRRRQHGGDARDHEVDANTSASSPRSTSWSPVSGWPGCCSWPTCRPVRPLDWRRHAADR